MPFGATFGTEQTSASERSSSRALFSYLAFFLQAATQDENDLRVPITVLSAPFFHLSFLLRLSSCALETLLNRV